MYDARRFQKTHRALSDLLSSATKVASIVMMTTQMFTLNPIVKLGLTVVMCQVGLLELRIRKNTRLRSIGLLSWLFDNVLQIGEGTNSVGIVRLDLGFCLCAVSCRFLTINKFLK